MTTPEIAKVKKRDGSIVDFEQARIFKAIFKALTVTGEGDEKTAEKISDRVVKILNRRFSKREIPDVEQIQDIVEEVIMMEDLIQTAKAYILYREQRRRMREVETIYDEAVEIYDKYINEIDWQVKENANMAYSLQGLNNYGVSTLTKRYWLNKIYPQQIREAMQSGDFHIHDLDFLGAYCCGWDLYDLLKRGFGGVAGKVESKPPKHLGTALGQAVNFFFTLQGEVAGAVAFSNFDTLLAPFIRYDKMDFKEVKQAMQEFLFGCAVPTRVGFQCLSQDTQILTADGWKKCHEIQIGETIKTFNIEKKAIEDKEVKSVFKKEYQGVMYNLKTSKQDQLISPGHRVVMKKSDGSFFVQPIEDILKMNSPIFIPIILQEGEVETEEIFSEKIKKIDYQGIIWCPNTDNETVIAKRNGRVFITGNTPFSNITIDIKPSPSYAKQPIIIGGEPQKETYGEFGEEMKIFNKAFFEAMLEGDKNSRIFTFPIPTIDITPDFPWDDEFLEPMWLATAKYGVNYFANFIRSDMKPEEVRSMCLQPEEEILIRNSCKIKRISIKEAAENYKKENFDEEGWAECEQEKNLEVLSLNPSTFKTEWAKVERFFRIAVKKAIEVETEDGKKAIFSEKHPMAVLTEQGIVMKWSKDIKRGDYLLSLKNAKENLSQVYQQIDDLILDEDLARILGYFIADGNYLFESRKGYLHFGEPRGLQFTFKTGDIENLDLIRGLIKKVFGLAVKEKQDPRYNTYYLYIYNTALSRKFYNAGFKKYGRLPQILFNSPVSVIENFLAFHFKGDGCTTRQEIHINDRELSRDLVILYSLIGKPVNYRLRKNSQRIYLQHAKTKVKNGNGWLNNPIISERVPAFLADGWKIPGFNRKKMIGFDTLEKHGAQTTGSFKVKNGNINVARVKKVQEKNFDKEQSFYDLELAKNHLFVHSLGLVSFNCCRLRLSNKELLRKGGGLFGANPLTGSLGVVTIGMSRIGYLSKTKKEFFERLERVMDLAKESLEIKRRTIEDFMRKGLYPYSRHYLETVEKMRGSYYGNHFSTIGILGMNECLLNFMGEDIGSTEGRKFALEVMDFMRERIIKYQEETGNLYNLESTPAEGASYRLALKDKEKYPEIITAGTNETPYYTNSTQLSVNYTDDIFKAVELQDELQCKYSGGCIQEGNKVLTDKGLLPIEYIVENFERLKPINALSYNLQKEISEWDNIVEAVAVDVEKHNKIRVKGERGLDVTTSDWHPFFVMERVKINPSCPVCKEGVDNIKGFAVHLRWDTNCRAKYKVMSKYRVVEKRADELKKGDYILQNAHNLFPEQLTQLNDELAWLLGFFIGDGCISAFVDNRGGNNLQRYKVRFFSSHRQALDKVAKILNDYFRCEVSVINNDERSIALKEVATSKKEAAEFFFKYGFKAGEKVYDVSITKEIKENFNKENVFSFLSGLMDSDGHINKKQGDFEYCTVSPCLADDILEICSIAGIMISKILKPVKRENEVDIWRLRIPKYGMTKIKNQLSNKVHPERLNDSLSNRRKRYLPVVRVKEVSKVNVENNQFYDLMTEKNHNYLAGKSSLVFIHNTVLHLFIGEQIKDIAAMKNLIKKIFSNHKLPYITLTPTFCYDEKTEILTENGWKRFSELGEEDKVLTANPVTKELNYQKPLRRFKFTYQGTMIHFESKTFDCMVTPDHRMFVSGKKVKMRNPKTREFIKSTKIYYFVKAQDISSIDKVPMTGYKWKGKNQKFFILPSVINNKTMLSTEIKRLLDEYENKTHAEIAALANCSQSFVTMVKNGDRGTVENYSAIKIPMSSWLKFFGIWIAEGSVRGSKGGDTINKCEIVITQKNNKIRDEIREMLKELPFKFSESAHGFYIYNKQLWHYLTQFGNSRTKYIPEGLKMLPPKMLQLLLEWYLKGDGIKGTNYCSSVSKRLRDDLQEIYLKIGSDASISNKGNRGIVTKRTHKYTYLKEIQHKVQYSGYVYCVEVPNHVIYVRRNSKPNFSGNSICPSHGYLSGEHWKCPKCTFEQPCEVYSRVVGYIRPVQQWHKGKAQEFKERKSFQLPISNQ